LYQSCQQQEAEIDSLKRAAFEHRKRNNEIGSDPRLQQVSKLSEDQDMVPVEGNFM
jgi:hypothetical protein